MKNDGDVVDLKGLNGDAPLIAASKRGYVDVCKYLVEENKADIDLKDDWGKTALQYTCNPEIINIFKKKSFVAKK